MALAAIHYIMTAMKTNRLSMHTARVKEHDATSQLHLAAVNATAS